MLFANTNNVPWGLANKVYILLFVIPPHMIHLFGCLHQAKLEVRSESRQDAACRGGLYLNALSPLGVECVCTHHHK